MLAIGAVDALRVHYAVAAVHTIVAIALAYVGHRLRLVVQTEGNDVELFLQSLDGIGGAFGMRLIATAIALVSAALMYGVFLALIQG